MFLEMLRSALEMHGGVTISGAATSVSDGLAICRRCSPDLLIVDLSLADGSGLDVARHAVTLLPAIKVIVLSAQVRTFVCPTWLQRHLHAVVDKLRTFQDLRAALDRLAKPSTLPQNHEVARVVPGRDDDDEPGDATLRGKPLSQRERQVFALIGEGLLNREIGERLDLSEETIRAHRKRIARKLGTRGNELAKRAIEHRAQLFPPLDR